MRKEHKMIGKPLQRLGLTYFLLNIPGAILGTLMLIYPLGALFEGNWGVLGLIPVYIFGMYLFTRYFRMGIAKDQNLIQAKRAWMMTFIYNFGGLVLMLATQIFPMAIYPLLGTGFGLLGLKLVNEQLEEFTTEDEPIVTANS
ncbi:hypothetical protein [Pontibacter sp. G13]|uniref:hypothetical protein n=1 Tax=Pontibacter sp. G13 TaxID=3074898 RepID=UPI00288BB82D|nr:hypothetical protein [Pontibacter sp. G13]WNJ15956.1 hypothetical protein RJD25_13925 [Pontibacter sp. G13]